MGLEPLKKELESIDQELETAMLHLSETTQRVDEILSDFSGDGETRSRVRKPPLVLHTVETSPQSEEQGESIDEEEESSSDDEGDDEEEE